MKENILKNKQYKTYDKLSRYSQFPVYYNSVDEKWVTATTSYLSQEDTPYQNYTVVGTESYDLLALAFYNNPTLYWVICDFNRIQDCFTDPIKGTVLKIPVLSSIKYRT